MTTSPYNPTAPGAIDSLNEEIDSDATSHALNGISMQILGGFLMALGTTAVAVAFVTLNAATFGTAGLTVATVGSASLLSGYCFFVAGQMRNSIDNDDDDADLTDPVEYHLD